MCPNWESTLPTNAVFCKDRKNAACESGKYNVHFLIFQWKSHIQKYRLHRPETSRFQVGQKVPLQVEIVETLGGVNCSFVNKIKIKIK